MYKRILVPLDGSMLAEKALPYAVRLANRLDAQLFLVRAVETPLLLSNVRQGEYELAREAEAYLERITRWISSRTLTPHTDTNRIHTAVVKGDATREISYYATNLEIDLVVMTTHGRGGFTRLVTGSVARKILHKLTIPVLLVRPFAQNSSQLLAETFSGVGEPYSNRFKTEGGQVLLTLDGSAMAEAAIEPACELAQKLKAELHLLRVNSEDVPVFYSDFVGMSYFSSRFYDDEAENEMASTSYLTSISRRLAEKNIRPVIAVRKGNIAEQIVNYAGQIKAEAIVMATHAPGELGWLITGSTAEQVMRLSHMPVLMLPVHGPLPAASANAAKLTAVG